MTASISNNVYGKKVRRSDKFGDGLFFNFIVWLKYSSVDDPIQCEYNSTNKIYPINNELEIPVAKNYRLASCISQHTSVRRN